MYSFRPFCNADPPHIARIWASQPPQRGLAQPISLAMLEEAIFSKHYFDREGFLVAVQDDTPVGFAHAGFGTNQQGDALSYENGSTFMVMVRGDLWSTSLPDELLRESERHLLNHGAKALFAGVVRPWNGFYLGLYGGSELPGVLLSDPQLRPLLARNQYRERGRVVILQRDLIRFRPLVSRDQRRIRREVQFEMTYAPPTRSWWETSVWGGVDRLAFHLFHRRRSQVLAKATFWDIEPLATSWGLRTAGLFNLWVDDTAQRQGFATYLLSEAFKELHKRGFTLIETQTMLTNTPALEFYKKLGFAPIDHGLIFRRESRL